MLAELYLLPPPPPPFLYSLPLLSALLRSTSETWKGGSVRDISWGFSKISIETCRLDYQGKPKERAKFEMLLTFVCVRSTQDRVRDLVGIQ